jgi:hypothetical protein
MRIGKTIGGKLYLGFGLVLGTVIVMFLVNYIAVLHEQSTRALYQKSIKMADNLAKLGQTVEGLRLLHRERNARIERESHYVFTEPLFGIHVEAEFPPLPCDFNHCM